MEANLLHIKNMMCPRCIWAVEEILTELHIDYKSVGMGEVITVKPKDQIENMDELKKSLWEFGFDLLEEKKMQVVEQIKAYVIYWVRHAADEREKWNFSGYLSMKLGRDYKYLRASLKTYVNIFS